MGLYDLSQVTRVLTRLIQESVTISPAWAPSPAPSVSALPPDALTGQDTLGFYLYHVADNPQLAGIPPLGAGTPPTAHTPLGIDLFYQLTAHANGSSEDSALLSQRLFGAAIKGLHSHAIVTDRTEVNGVRLLEVGGLDGRDNRLHITRHQLPPEDAVSYWTAGQAPLRLAAYYCVSVVMLEPEPPPGRSGRVARYGVSVFVGGAPRLDFSESEARFLVPGEASERSVALRPAQVSVGQRFVLHGTDLSGDRTTLRFESADWDAPVEADPGLWSVVSAPTQVHASLQARAGGRDFIPGTYSVRAAVSRRRTTTLGTSREETQLSNATPLVVTPHVSDPGSHTAGATLTLTGGAFEHPDIPTDPDDPRSVQIYLADRALRAGTGALAPGHFEVLSSTQISLRLPDDLTPGDALPVRVIVRGAESQPGWVRVTP